MKPIVLFGAGSPLIVDFEESCAAAGREIRAIVSNRSVPSKALNVGLVRQVADIDMEFIDSEILIPLFAPGNRKSAFNELSSLLTPLGEPVNGATLVDPSSQVPASTFLGQGTYVNAGATIGAAGLIHDYCLINRACSIGHHAQIASFVSLGPGVVCAGNVAIDCGAVIGAGAVVLPGMKIGANAVVGAGAIVTRHVPANCFVAGNPARVLKQGIAGYHGMGVP